jgi:hypothetical protein
MARKNSKAGQFRPHTAIPGPHFDPEREERKLRRKILRKGKHVR